MHGSVGAPPLSLDETTTTTAISMSNGGMKTDGMDDMSMSSVISIPQHDLRHRGGGELSIATTADTCGNGVEENVGERIKLPGFSEIIRVTEP